MMGAAHLQLEARQLSFASWLPSQCPPGQPPLPPTPPVSIHRGWARRAAAPFPPLANGVPTLTGSGGDTGACQAPPAKVQELIVKENPCAR